MLRPILGTVVLLGALAALSVAGCSGSRKPDVQTKPLVPNAGEQSQLTAVSDSVASRPQPPAPVETRAKAAEVRENWGWIKHEWINVRRKPTTKSEIITKLERGGRVKLLEHAGDWWQVELADGGIAYIYSPLVFHEPYVDPWTTFKMGCRRADTSLSVVIAVTRYSEDDEAAAYVTVADVWYDYPETKHRQVAEASYSYWLDCLEQSGHETEGATIIIRDDIGKDIVKVSGSRDKPTLKALD